MSQALLWITIIVAGVMTLGLRLSFIVFMNRVQILPMLRQALRFVPIAVLCTLIAPALFFPAGPLDLSLTNFRLIAGVLAILVAWRTRNVLLTIVAGMACLLFLQALATLH
jgi:branched-subunit amino acid transport protein